jgi:hypothetical protein
MAMHGPLLTWYLTEQLSASHCESCVELQGKSSPINAAEVMSEYMHRNETLVLRDQTKLWKVCTIDREAACMAIGDHAKVLQQICLQVSFVGKVFC